MQITTKGLTLVLAGDAALLVGALGLASVLELSRLAGIVLIVAGIALNAYGVLGIIRAAQQRND